MNILTVSDVYHPDMIGGAGRVASELDQGLAAQGARVRVLTRQTRTAHEPRATRGGVEIYRFAVDNRNPVSFYQSTIHGVGDALALALDGFTPDVLNFHQPLVARAALDAHTLRGVPAVYTFHSSWADELQTRGGWHRLMSPAAARIERRVLAECRMITVLSEYSRRRVTRILPTACTEIVPGGVDLAAFPVKTIASLGHEPILLTIRNLVPRMGLDTLILAALQLQQEGIEFRLRIGGAGPLANELRTLARPLGDHCEFLGRIPEKNLAAEYRAADLFIIPTREIEGFGLVILESFASGTPVIGTPVGAIAELVGRQGHGFVSASASPGDLADTIRDALHRRESDPGLPTPIELRALAERYSWRRRAVAMERIFTGLAS